MPNSVPGLVTKKVLVMNFIEGVKITDLGNRMKDVSELKKKIFIRRIISCLSQAYGTMLLGSGIKTFG